MGALNSLSALAELLVVACCTVHSVIHQRELQVFSCGYLWKMWRQFVQRARTRNMFPRDAKNEIQVLLGLRKQQLWGIHYGKVISYFSVSASSVICITKKLPSDIPCYKSHRFQTVTFNRWRTVVSATWKCDIKCVVIFPFLTNYRVSYVLSSDQLQESWIICKLKSFSTLYLHDLILNTDDLYSVCLKRYAILVIKNSFKLTEE